jgi:heptosyltransferase-1
MTPPSPDTDAPKRILIVRLSAHGDVIHTLPLLSALKTQWPDVFIGWLCEPAAAPLLEGHPLIDRLHIAKRPQWLKKIRQPGQWLSIAREASAFVQELKAADYEISMDVQGLLKSAVWPWLAGIPTRMGFRATRESADRFYTRCLCPMDLRDAQVPAVQRYLDFARNLGVKVSQPTFILPTPSDQAKAQADTLLAAISHKGPLVALAPFTRWASKHWMPEHWQTLIRALIQKDCQLVLLGGPNDQSATDALLAGLPGDFAFHPQLINAVGKTDWPTMQALLQRCDTLVGPDSAPLHLADALGKPVLALFGPTAPGRTGPVGISSHILAAGVLCQPCFNRKCPLPEKICMTQLTPTLVLEELNTILSLASLGRFS